MSLGTTRFRLRTKLVLWLIVTTAVLTLASLLSVQSYLRERARTQIREQLAVALKTFEQFALVRQEQLRQSSVMLADQPIIRALMSTGHAETIQDGSADVWNLAEEIDLLVLTDPAGQILALHSRTEDFDRPSASAAVGKTLHDQLSRDWWYGAGRLYDVLLQPVYLGSPGDNALTGILAAGFAIDDAFARTIGRVTSSDAVFWYGDTVAGSSMDAGQRADLSYPDGEGRGASEFLEFSLKRETFVGASVDLFSPAGRPRVTLTLLSSYDDATQFLDRINRLLLTIGLVALVAGGGVMYFISRTFIRPLERLASGVAALEGGDFGYPLGVGKHDEVGELTAAFVAMRQSLGKHQRELLHAERLATIGRMASTVSHDLRHPLTTILAYAELLSERSLTDRDRLEIYRQIRLSVNNMADLIASLLEFSKAQEAVRLTYGDCVDALRDAVRTIGMRPEFREIRLELAHEGPTEGWFDFPKLDRAFQNLLRNACEAVAPEGCVRIEALGRESQVEISIADDGPGIPEGIREDLFQPFVTSGKSDGTGLGLAVVQKIVRDHGGDVDVESTGPKGTTFRLKLPITAAAKPKTT